MAEVTKRLSDDVADQIWKVLVDRAGASDSRDDRETFVSYALRNPIVKEYRFMGYLGMGGKVRLLPDKWSVDCYPEDMNDLRRQLIANTNHDLAELKKQYEEE